MIIFDKVYFKYQSSSNYVLNNIDLKIEEGELVAIMGDNGAGKTTLAKHMNGLLKPTKGEVYIDGINTKEISVSELAKNVALVFQYPEKMFFSEKVWDEVAFALKNFEYDESSIKKLVSKALHMFWLQEYKDRSPYTLSGGEQRRLAIASAVVWDPKYIIFDEPTAGQDAIQRETLLDIINMMVRNGKSVILISHDVEFISEISPRVLLLKEGEIIFDGNAQKLFRNFNLLLSSGLIQPYIYQLENRLRDVGVLIREPESFEDLINIIMDLALRGH